MNLILPSHELVRVFLLLVPLVIGGTIHMVAVKWNVLSYFKKPIHQRWFGLNKTWRGFIVMPFATWLGVILAQGLEKVADLNTPLLQDKSSFVLALALGLGYCLAELPNSFLKRRLGIKEGLTSQKYKWFFIILDQADSAFGCSIAYNILIPMSLLTMISMILLGTIIHLIINISLYLAGIRRNPF
jgi:hypothetical protein